MCHGPLGFNQADGFVLLHGHPAVLRLGLYATAAWALAETPVLYLDGANAFDPFVISRLARANRSRPRDVLTAIHVSRAFTCHQMVRLVTEGLAPALQAHRARAVILSGPLETFYDEAVPDHEVVRLARTLLASVRHVTRRGCQVLCLCPPPPLETQGGRALLLETLRGQADRAVAVEETEAGLFLRDARGCSPKSWHIPRALWERA